MNKYTGKTQPKLIVCAFTGLFFTKTEDKIVFFSIIKTSMAVDLAGFTSR